MVRRIKNGTRLLSAFQKNETNGFSQHSNNISLYDNFRRIWTHWQYNRELNQWEFNHRITRIPSLQQDILDTLPATPPPPLLERITPREHNQTSGNRTFWNENNLHTNEHRPINEHYNYNTEENVHHFAEEKDANQASEQDLAQLAIILTPSPVPGPAHLDNSTIKRKREEQKNKPRKMATDISQIENVSTKKRSLSQMMSTDIPILMTEQAKRVKIMNAEERLQDEKIPMPKEEHARDMSTIRMVEKNNQEGISTKQSKFPYCYRLDFNENNVIESFCVDASDINDAWLKYLDKHNIRNQKMESEKRMKLVRIDMIKHYGINSL